MGQVQHQSDDWKVVLAEAARFLPVIAIAKQAMNRNRVPHTVAGANATDARDDQSTSNLWFFAKSWG